VGTQGERRTRWAFDGAFRADLIVEGAVIVEMKSVSGLAPVYARQLLTYLRLLDLRVGLLLNFNSLHLSDGITRVVNRTCRLPRPPLPPRPLRETPSFR
jgi:iron complex transport system substrate-binding protein